MSTESTRIVHDYLDALNRGDGEALFASFHPEIEFREPDTVPYGGTWKGIDGMQAFLGAAAEHLVPESIKVVPVEVIDAGDRVVVRALLQAKARKSGAEFDAPLVEIIRVEDGKIREVLVYSDTATIVAATR